MPPSFIKTQSSLQKENFSLVVRARCLVECLQVPVLLSKVWKIRAHTEWRKKQEYRAEALLSRLTTGLKEAAQGPYFFCGVLLWGSGERRAWLLRGIVRVILFLIDRFCHKSIFVLHMSRPIMHLILIECMSDYA